MPPKAKCSFYDLRRKHAEPFCVPQNPITCTGQVWRQVFIAVVTFVAAIQQSQFRNPKCYSTFSCLLTQPTLGITTVSHKEVNNFHTYILHPVQPYYFHSGVGRIYSVCHFNKEQVQYPSLPPQIASVIYHTHTVVSR